MSATSDAARRPGEFELIARYFAPMAGAGGLDLLDDAAVIRPSAGDDLVVSNDALVAGVHFFPDDPPAAIARKALRVNLSDLAAKGAAPCGFLLTLGLPADWTEAWLAGFADGLAADSRAYACPLLGGDTVKAAGGLFLALTVFGTLPAGSLVRRTTGHAGDRLLVTGTIGDAALGLRLRLQPDAAWAQALSAQQRGHLLNRYLYPEPRTIAAALVRRHASAAMDISDGLIGDCAKLASVPALGRDVAINRVPLSDAARAAIAAEPDLLEIALGGGDDYEILAAVPTRTLSALLGEASAIGLPITEIGELGTAGGSTRWLDGDGRVLTWRKPSYRHF